MKYTNLEEKFFVIKHIRNLRTDGHTLVYGYRIEEMEEQSDILLTRLFTNLYRAKQTGGLDELITNYLFKLENKI